ncbi:MAG: hypothetical protein HRF50_03455 [Phycisphaerae bacterium]
MTTLEFDELLALAAGTLLTVALAVALAFWIVMECRAASSARSPSPEASGSPSSVEDD